MRLVNELGFDAVDVGAWMNHGDSTPAHTADFDADGVRRALARPAKCARHNGSH